MLSIYNYMASGILLSGIVALLFAVSGMAEQVMFTPLRWVVALAPLGFIMAMSFGVQKMQTSDAADPVLAIQRGSGPLAVGDFPSLYGALDRDHVLRHGGVLRCLSLVGYTTKRDLSAMGSFLIMGLIGILVAMLINMFLQSTGLALAISILGVLIFAGLTAWDTQRLKNEYYQVAGNRMGRQGRDNGRAPALPRLHQPVPVPAAVHGRPPLKSVK
jgi:FtsH-binding integral membrane protein